MLRIAIVGVAGRMGRALVEAVLQDSDCAVAVATVRHGSPLVGTDLGALVGRPDIGVRIVDDLSNSTEKFNLLIDFSTPENTMANLAFAAASDTPMVIGTTGLSELQLDKLRRYATQIPICFAANFSTGVTLCLQLLRQAAKVLGQDADIEVTEAHHRHKVDAPSGTALAMGHAIAETLGRNSNDCFVYSREGITGPREAGTIGFSVIRAGDIVGDHSVIFASEGERVEITHKASSRMAFARGAVRAARWLSSKPAGLYNMNDVLDL